MEGEVSDFDIRDDRPMRSPLWLMQERMRVMTGVEQLRIGYGQRPFVMARS